MSNRVWDNWDILKVGDVLVDPTDPSFFPETITDIAIAREYILVSYETTNNVHRSLGSYGPGGVFRDVALDVGTRNKQKVKKELGL